MEQGEKLIGGGLAGLGIGGIALALAAQTILGDLFGYFVILFDCPFEIVYYVERNARETSIRTPDPRDDSDSHGEEQEAVLRREPGQLPR